MDNFKALLLFPTSYSIINSIESALSGQGVQLARLNYHDTLHKWDKKLNPQMFRFPDKVRIKWESYFFKKINQWYIEQFSRLQPDLVFVYNNEMLLPETLAWLKERKVKLAFFLGDNPLYTPTSRYNVAVLEYADAIFVPDTFWQQQLKKIGLPQVHHLLLPLPESTYYPLEKADAQEREQLGTDILYVGMAYNDSWGYKKARFLSYFVNNKLQIHGNNAWKRWFAFFPELEQYYIEKKAYISVEQLNKMYNYSKIIPVDGNPGIFNGIHIRITEALASGTLPLMEWHADLDSVFDGVDDLPAVKDYRAIPEMVAFYLNDENARTEKVLAMRKCYQSKYETKETGAYLIDRIGI